MRTGSIDWVIVSKFQLIARLYWFYLFSLSWSKCFLIYFLFFFVWNVLFWSRIIRDCIKTKIFVIWSPNYVITNFLLIGSSVVKIRRECSFFGWDLQSWNVLVGFKHFWLSRLPVLTMEGIWFPVYCLHSMPEDRDTSNYGAEVWVSFVFNKLEWVGFNSFAC